MCVMGDAASWAGKLYQVRQWSRDQNGDCGNWTRPLVRNKTPTLPYGGQIFNTKAKQTSS